MYEYIQGVITGLSPAHAVVEAGGVGYYLIISLQTYSELEHSESARVYTHFIVREDAQLLYGFATKEERELFRLLVSVSGVGGNTARMILSTYSTQELSNIIASENAALLKNVKGLGLKTAQKIIVELKDKIAGLGSNMGLSPLSSGPAGSNTCDEALAALAMLGFGKAASDKVVRGIIRDNPSAAVEDVIRLSLKKL
jgi:Holliday junction DNA helicase RuvA